MRADPFVERKRATVDWRYLAVATAGGSAFIDMYATQPLLPALRAAIDRGIAEIEALSAAAAVTARAAIRGIDGFELTVLDDAQASGVATAFRATDPDTDPARVLASLRAQGITAVKEAPGPRMRWTHYGEAAEPEYLARVTEALTESLAVLPR